MSWQEQALCAGIADADVFFPYVIKRRPNGSTREPEYDAARAICNSCPVTAACLRDAMETEPAERRDGMRGGTTPNERRALANHARYLRFKGATGELPEQGEPKRLTQQQHQARLDDYHAGMSDIAMAAHLGLAATTIRRWRVRNKLPTNNPDRSKTVSRASEATRMRMWRAGATDTEIGAAVNVLAGAIARWRQARGLRINSARRAA